MIDKKIIVSFFVFLVGLNLLGNITIYNNNSHLNLNRTKGNLYLVPISSMNLEDFNYCSDTMSFRLYYKSKWIEFMPPSAWIKDTIGIKRIPYNAEFIRDTLFLPLQSFLYIVKNVFYMPITIADSIIYIGKRKPNITNVMMSTEYGNTVIKIKTAQKMDFNYSLGSDTTLIVHFPGGYADRNKINFESNSGIIKKLIADNKTNGTNISVTFSKSMVLDSVKNNYSFVKFVFHKTKTKKKTTNHASYKIETVIIDPGHGGRDPGAIGPSGLKEKDVTLDIAKRLKKILKKKGYKVIMTRDKDKYVSLKSRAKLANKYKNAIFVSIHCNAVPRKKKNKVRGTETYFLSPAKTDWARAVEARENASFDISDNSNDMKGIDYIFFDMAQNEFLEASNMLAEEIQQQLPKKLKIPDRKVSQAGFYVLKKIFMPGVLVETAFISHYKEEKLLKSSAFRQKIAEGIAKGIYKFKEKYERKLKK